MIAVEYLGNLGNQLFQYAFGRILAQELGYRLIASPIAGFDGTNELVDGHVHDSPVEAYRVPQDPELSHVLDNRCPRKIVVNSYVQQYRSYKPYKSQLRQWLAVERHSTPGPNDLVLNMRLGRDYLDIGWVLDPQYYLEIVKVEKFNTLHIVTDDPRSPLLEQFRAFRPNVFHESVLDDFRFVRSARKIVLSQSTFSWWAGFLSDARKIYFPITANSIWSAESPVDLWVDDEPRYELVRARPLAVTRPVTFRAMRQDVSASDVVADRTHRILILVHVDRFDTWHEMFRNLVRLSHKIGFDLGVNVMNDRPPFAKMAQIGREVRMFFPQARVIPSSKCGVDIGSVLALLEHFDLAEYDYICKIDAPLSSNAMERGWTRQKERLDAVLGEPQAILAAFRDPTIAMIVSEALIASRFDANLADWSSLCGKPVAGRASVGGDFVISTMFWCRAGIMQRLKDCGHKQDDLEIGYSTEGALAHEMKRAFDSLPRSEGRIVGVPKCIAAIAPIETRGRFQCPIRSVSRRAF